MDRKPNILFAIADDASHFGAYGHSFVKTPNIDRVARQGILFENAFTTNPKCAPSRACILTGRYPWQLEEACNHYSIFPSKYGVFPDRLEEAGYFIGHTGKGWAPGDWKAGGFQRNPAGPMYNDARLTPPENSAITPCDYAGNFKKFLSLKEDDQPFFFWYGCYEPHRPYIFGEGLRDAKKLEDVTDIPSYWPQNDIVRQDILDYALEIEWFDAQLGNMLKHLEEIGELENTLVIVTSDNGCPFPRVKGQMYEQDFHLPLIAMWQAVCAGGRRVEDMISFVDYAPTFLEAAGVDIPAQISGTSFLEQLQSDRSGRIDTHRDTAYFGREKHDVGRQGDVGYPVRCIRDREYLYIHNFEPDRWPAGDPETGYTNCDGGPTKQEVLALHAIGDNRYYQWCFGRRPREELYNIQKDPECLENLSGLPAYLAVKERMWHRLEEFLKQTADPRIFGRGEIFDQYPYVGASDHSWEAYEQKRWKYQNY